MAILVGHTELSGARFNPSIVNNNLSLYLDAGNYPRSFPDIGSTWYDLSGNNRNGTLINSPAYVNPGSTGYFSFDGLDDNLTTNYAVTSTPALGNWTYEIWTEIATYPSSIAGILYRKGTLFGAMNDAGAALYWYGDTSGSSCAIYGIIRGNDAYRSTAGFSMALNRTYQFTLVNNYSVGFFRLYVNGIIFASGISPTQEYNAGNVSGLNIGISQPQFDMVGSGVASYYGGYIKNAKIYNVALNAAQVSQNFKAFRGRYGV